MTKTAMQQAIESWEHQISVCEDLNVGLIDILKVQLVVLKELLFVEKAQIDLLKLKQNNS